MEKRSTERSEKATPSRATAGAPTKLCRTTPRRTARIIGLSVATPGMSRNAKASAGDDRRQGEARRQRRQAGEGERERRFRRRDWPWDEFLVNSSLIARRD